MKQGKHFIVDILFVLALFGVFAFCALMLVTVGANVYRKTVQDMSDNYESRTSTTYLAEKIKQNNYLLSTGEQAITLENLSGKPALCLLQEINDEQYCTYLYLFEGYLKELFTQKDRFIGEDTLRAGQNIVKLSSLEFSFPKDNLIAIQLTTPSGNKQQLFLSILQELD